MQKADLHAAMCKQTQAPSIVPHQQKHGKIAI